jgi:hypothetical protein
MPFFLSFSFIGGLFKPSSRQFVFLTRSREGAKKAETGFLAL